MHINVYDNYDEYDPEAAAIVDHLPECKNIADLKTIFESVFEEFFGPQLDDKYLNQDQIIEDIWKIYSRTGLR